ncbi:MAG: hypothetical protein VW349_01255, partial [Gammaproteobacteria bacterium]
MARINQLVRKPRRRKV